MVNLTLLEETPRWRAYAAAKCAKLLGIRIHIEGIPFGSNRCVTDTPSRDTSAARVGARTKLTSAPPQTISQITSSGGPHGQHAAQATSSGSAALAFAL